MLQKYMECKYKKSMKGMKSIPKDNTIIYDLYLDEKRKNNNLIFKNIIAFIN